MIVNGVSFNEEKIKSMKKKAFVDQLIQVHFLEKPEEDRRKLLEDIYDKIVGVSTKV